MPPCSAHARRDNATSGPLRHQDAHHYILAFVKLLARLVRPVYSVEKRSSKEQLRDDFGDFPPAPLRCENLSGDFYLVRTRGIGEIYHSMVMLKRMVRGMESDPQTLSPEAMDLVGGALAFRRSLDTLSCGSPLARSFWISIGLGFVFILKTVNTLRYGRDRPNALGLFVGVRKDESEIIIFRKTHVLQKKSEAPTVSHEHIHMLQHKSAERHSRYLRSPQTLLNGDLIQPSTLYLMEKCEVEARLHECVLSFYQTHRQLPVTVPAFMGLLASNPHFGSLVSGVLIAYGAAFDKNLGNYADRGSFFSQEMEAVLLLTKSTELMFRYITEVLSVMYGNLLKYYGDDVASCNYLKDIARPNFYDELYGPEVV